MVYDLKISHGFVVDGTGAPGRQMDIGIVGDRIVAVGDLPDAAHKEIDASGRGPRRRSLYEQRQVGLRRRQCGRQRYQCPFAVPAHRCHQPQIRAKFSGHKP